MKVLLSSIGTRGDIEPFLAVGQMIKAQGHDVVCTMPEQFGPLVAEAGLQFRSLGPEFIDMLDSEDGRRAMGGGGGSPLKKFASMVRLARLGPIVNREMIARQCIIFEEEKPDRVVCNGKSTYPFIWQIEGQHLHIERPAPTVLIPIPYMHYVEGHAHLVFNRNLGSVLNKLSFKLTDLGLIQSIMISIKNLSLAHPIKRREVKKAAFSANTIYTISPTLFPRPTYWPLNLQVLGYHERTIQSDWKPSAELEEFLDSEEKIIFITFGSMTNPAPKKVTELLLTACKRAGVKAVFNTAAGGLAEPETYDKSNFYFLERVPYGWIFPKVYAVVHHGGSGTTHTALKYGCASMIIPHIIDQFAWNKIVASKGAGPKGPSIAKLQRKKNTQIESLLKDLVSNASYKVNAKRLSQIINSEDHEAALLQRLTGDSKS
ncbi:MAG: glycosyltransferase [Saprospiraceae bacterium]